MPMPISVSSSIVVLRCTSLFNSAVATIRFLYDALTGVFRDFLRGLYRFAERRPGFSPLARDNRRVIALSPDVTLDQRPLAFWSSSMRAFAHR